MAVSGQICVEMKLGTKCSALNISKKRREKCWAFVAKNLLKTYQISWNKILLIFKCSNCENGPEGPFLLFMAIISSSQKSIKIKQLFDKNNIFYNFHFFINISYQLNNIVT